MSVSIESVELTDLALPDFGLPHDEPVIAKETYATRIELTRRRAEAAGFDVLLVYGDREHFANLAYLTGYDPRFEEALPVFRSGRVPILLVGNEGLAYSAVVPIEVERVLYQTFSLPGQPRSCSAPLAQLLAEAGLACGQTVGVAGWKYFTREETETPDEWIEIPSFIAATLRGLGCQLRNANRLFMDPSDGLRAINEIEQLARFEFTSIFSSQGVRNIIFGVQPGMSELESVPLMALNGLPLSCHPILVGGPRTELFIPSPSAYRLR